MVRYSIYIYFLSYPTPISSPSNPPERPTQCIPLLTSCPLPVKLELCVCACVWNVVNYHETHQWKKDDLAPSVAIHCQELLVSHPPHSCSKAGWPDPPQVLCRLPQLLWVHEGSFVSGRHLFADPWLLRTCWHLFYSVPWVLLHLLLHIDFLTCWVLTIRPVSIQWLVVLFYT